MSFRNSIEEYRSSRSQVFEPIVLTFPIKQEYEQTHIHKIDQDEIVHTVRKLRSIERSIPFQFIFKSFILLLLGLVLFYILLIVIAVMLFNVVLALVSLILITNYLRWSFVSLRKLRKEVNLRKTKKFLQEQNRRYYSTKLIRFQLIEHENCIKILNLRFSQ